MASGVDPSGGFGRLNENVDLLLETVDAVAADVAASRSYLERLSRTIPDDPPTVNDRHSTRLTTGSGTTMLISTFFQCNGNDSHFQRWKAEMMVAAFKRHLPRIKARVTVGSFAE